MYALRTKFLDFLITKGGFGYGECIEIFGGNRTPKMWCKFNECLRNEIYFWSKLSKTNRKKWFDYIHSIQAKDESYRQYQLGKNFTWFDQHMKLLIYIDKNIRKFGVDFLEKRFAYIDYYDPSHFYEKWLGYGKNTLALLRSMDPIAISRFVPAVF